MSKNSAILTRCPSEYVWILSLSQASLFGQQEVKGRQATLQAAQNMLIKVFVDEETKHL
ncbi:MAG TPA: hypothetical protein VJT15_23570 [Pyrinomonadaceae bacterium]|nr:hypothetical protein [Pyrinomonadaceae bacterium]